MAEFGELTAEQQAQLKTPFDELRAARSNGQTLVAVIRDACGASTRRDIRLPCTR